MKASSRLFFVASSVAFALGAAPAFADKNLSGTLLHENAAADRTLVIDAGTKGVSVTHMETVKFVVKGADGKDKSFVYKFDTPQGGQTAIDLTKVAPAGMLKTSVKAFINDHPSYHRN